MVRATNTSQDADYFLTLQTQTGWGRVLVRFRDWMEVGTGALTLDVGCGPGLLPGLLAQNGARSFGVDLDPRMFEPQPLHPDLAIADVFHLPFPNTMFDLVTASNLLFLLADPVAALEEISRLLKPGGRVALLNPSEYLSLDAAGLLADQRNLEGLARDTLLNWAARAEANFRWTEGDLASLLGEVGLSLERTATVMGPGFARFALGIRD